MRVLAFSDLGPPEGSGGVERTLAEIYPRLVAAGRADVSATGCVSSVTVSGSLVTSALSSSSGSSPSNASDASDAGAT